MLNEQEIKQIQERLKEMTDPIMLKFFTQKIVGTCQYCSETEKLLKEVCELTNLISLTVHSFVNDKSEVEKYRIDKIPATVIEGEKDYGLRFYGIPAGYEFATFLESILKVSSKKSGLNQNLLQEMNQIHKPVHIQVFVTPTCPYCQGAALTAYQLAMENEQIQSDIVEVSEFPHLAQKYGVMGVPKIVINEDHSFEGALPEHLFIDHVIKAAQ